MAPTAPTAVGISRWIVLPPRAGIQWGSLAPGADEPEAQQRDQDLDGVESQHVDRGFRGIAVQRRVAEPHVDAAEHREPPHD